MWLRTLEIYLSNPLASLCVEMENGISKHRPTCTIYAFSIQHENKYRKLSNRRSFQFQAVCSNVPCYWDEGWSYLVPRRPDLMREINFGIFVMLMYYASKYLRQEMESIKRLKSLIRTLYVLVKIYLLLKRKYKSRALRLQLKIPHMFLHFLDSACFLFIPSIKRNVSLRSAKMLHHT